MTVKLKQSFDEEVWIFRKAGLLMLHKTNSFGSFLHYLCSASSFLPFLRPPTHLIIYILMTQL